MKFSGTTSQNNESQRREDNPFSFKHFLRSDSSNSYQSKGARPKVYYENRSQSTDYGSSFSENKQVKVPEFSSALPDFVQDHLVIEQCYLGNNSVNNYDLGVGNLPDFTPNRENRPNLDSDNHRDDRNNDPVPLDLPFRSKAFPLDLPIAGSSSNGTRNIQSISEVCIFFMVIIKISVRVMQCYLGKYFSIIFLCNIFKAFIKSFIHSICAVLSNYIGLMILN